MSRFVLIKGKHVAFASKDFKNSDDLWSGLFSKSNFQGNIIQFVRLQLALINHPFMTVLVSVSDGDIMEPEVELMLSQIPFAVDKSKLFVSTLAQTSESPNLKYLYMPLDDSIFHYGIRHTFPSISLPSWESRSSTLFWRGGQSGNKNDEPAYTLRYRLVDALINVPNTDCRLLRGWERGYEPAAYFAPERVDPKVLLKYKIFLIVDGNCIASNHMWGFSVGCVPFLISRARCWFQDYIVPFEHYIPIAYNLSNLLEMVEWVLCNDSKAKKIAMNAYELSCKIFSGHFQRQYLTRQLVA